MQERLCVKVLLRIAINWKSTQKTGSIATLDSNAYSLTKKKASLLVTCSVDQLFCNVSKKETCIRTPDGSPIGRVPGWRIGERRTFMCGTGLPARTKTIRADRSSSEDAIGGGSDGDSGLRRTQP